MSKKYSLKNTILLCAFILVCSSFICKTVSWNPQKNEQVIPWGAKTIKADMAWNFCKGKHVKVAILDSGIDLDHPDLKDNLKGGYNAITPSSEYEDDNGHGTFVAGIVGALDNKEGLIGVAPQADIYAVKVLGEFGTARVSDIIKGIEWAIDNKMQVINMSFYLSKDSIPLHEVIKKAYHSNIVLVAAAGDDGTINYPAAYPEVISVASIDNKNNIQICTNSSVKPDITHKVDFVAPGVSIYSTTIHGEYTYMSGTSMAAPYITGSVALLISQYKGIYTILDIKQRLEEYTKDLGVKGKDSKYGQGLIDVFKSLQDK